SPHGVGVEAHWKATADGTSSLGPVTRAGCDQLPLRVAGEVRGVEAAETVEERYLVQTDRFTHFALSATQFALDDARFGRADVESPYSVGVVTAAGSGGGEFGQRELQNLWSQGSRYVGP
ncbi:beta-ketoacyl synthase N-terminal-like domain-containing protein, partial [Streptomyces sp. 4F14]|uniref:beta-ketoacyl synthase N-terminal-like domain-containing protein n=1 Tax=Streptomyces sp. 4F14 TaxID=3394380 RepID=UPI003A89469A